MRGMSSGGAPLRLGQLRHDRIKEEFVADFVGLAHQHLYVLLHFLNHPLLSRGGIESGALIDRKFLGQRSEFSSVQSLGKRRHRAN